jgi:hypothetical protein
VTNASGQASVTYTAGSTPGTDTIQATANGVTGTVDITVERPAIGSVTVSAGASSIVADGVSRVAIQATVRDTSGSGIAGITVTFATTAGSLSAASAVTNSSGVATVDLISSTQTGTATVTAAAEGFSDSVTVTFVAGPPATLVLTATPATLNAEETANVQAAVTDANANPVSGHTVTFSLLVNNSGASLAPLTDVTDTDGRVSITYTAGANPGTDTIRAVTTNGVEDTVDIVVQPEAVPASIQLLVSSPQLDSDGLDAVTLTAVVKDANNNVVPGVLVSFSATSGTIEILNNTTDATGAATARLTTGNDPTNRTITVTAATAGLSDSNNVSVSGTTVTFSGANALVVGDSTTLTIFLRDSSSRGIFNETVTISSALGNTLSSNTVTTDFAGQATVTVTATRSGTDVIQASGAGADGAFPLTVSSANFIFTAPPPASTVNLGAVQSVTVHWDEDGVNQAGATIDFAATRGTLTNPSTLETGSTVTATTDDDGNATVTITSNNAGPAVITAEADTPGGPSSQLQIEFIATVADSLILQADPATIGVNAPGSMDQQSIITAVVRDPQNNLVKNQRVIFSLTDVSGGSIFPASAVTDSFGRASTVYTAGLAPSAKDGVIIDGRVEGTPPTCNPADPIPTGPCDRVTLTVAQRSLFITLGTGNLIEAPSPTQYAKPYSILVTDAEGNAVAGQEITLSVLPTRYEKGFYVPTFDDEGNFVSWEKFRTIDSNNGGDDADQACNNEDVNGNGLLDIPPDVDLNNNSLLEPGNVATVDPRVVTTDASGFAFVDVLYAREFTWVEVALEARTTVAGSEFFSRAIFFLPGLASDFTVENVAPPGFISKFGRATTCTCSELSDPTCPTLLGLNPVTISLSSSTLTSVGGTITFTLSGGSQTAYDVQATAGTLNGVSQEPTPTPVAVNFGDTATLVVGVTATARTIIVSASDQVTGQLASALIDQAGPVTITLSTNTLPSGGGTVTFTISGGSQTTYDVEATTGTLNGVPQPSPVTVAVGAVATLVIDPTVTPRVITVTATDPNPVELPGTATITQTVP